jgi:hypothetical protein
METKADLENLAKDLNPVVGFYDPLNIADPIEGTGGAVAGWTDEQRIGFFRHAEIKHARVAMAAFVGYCVQANGIFFPGLGGDDTAALSPPAQWDALPTNFKLAVLLSVGLLEWIGEANGQKNVGLWDFKKFRARAEEEKMPLESSGVHYMTGGRPGVHPVWGLNTFAKGLSSEKKAEKLRAELNNGRLAMIGIMSLVAEAKVPGSVIALKGLGLKPYSGEVMAPFTANDVSLPFVSKMLELDPIGQFGQFR